MSSRASSAKSKSTKKPAAPPAKAAAASKPAAAKTAAPKTTAAKPAAPKAPKRAAATAKAAFYFVAGDYEPRITDKKPKPGGSVLEFPSFEEAKDQAVEQLIDLIDRCERRLWEIKRAENFEQYQKLAGSD